MGVVVPAGRRERWGGGGLRRRPPTGGRGSGRRRADGTADVVHVGPGPVDQRSGPLAQLLSLLLLRPGDRPDEAHVAPRARVPDPVPGIDWTRHRPHAEEQLVGQCRATVQRGVGGEPGVVPATGEQVRLGQRDEAQRIVGSGQRGEPPRLDRPHRIALLQVEPAEGVPRLGVPWRLGQPSRGHRVSIRVAPPRHRCLAGIAPHSRGRLHAFSDHEPCGGEHDGADNAALPLHALEGFAQPDPRQWIRWMALHDVGEQRDGVQLAQDVRGERDARHSARSLQHATDSVAHRLAVRPATAGTLTGPGSDITTPLNATTSWVHESPSHQRMRWRPNGSGAQSPCRRGRSLDVSAD